MSSFIVPVRIVIKFWLKPFLLPKPLQEWHSSCDAVEEAQSSAIRASHVHVISAMIHGITGVWRRGSLSCFEFGRVSPFFYFLGLFNSLFLSFPTLFIYLCFLYCLFSFFLFICFSFIVLYPFPQAHSEILPHISARCLSAYSFRFLVYMKTIDILVGCLWTPVNFSAHFRSLTL